MDPRQLLYLVRAVVVLAVSLALWWSWSELKATIRAPVEAKLDAAVGANHATKAAADAQSTAIAALHDAGEDRKAKSAAAMKAAGQDEFQRARAVTAKAAAGDTPLARAASRINAEFGR